VQRRVATADVGVVATGLFGAATVDLLVRTGCRRYRVLAWDDDGFLEKTLTEFAVQPFDLERPKTTAIDAAVEILREWMSDVDLLVTATRDAPNALFRAINDLSLHYRRPWLRANGDGSAIDLGPLFHPFESSCFTCLELRTRSAQGFAIENELYQSRLALEREAGDRTVVGEDLWSSTLGASILVGETFRVLTGLAPATLVDSVLRLTPLTGVIEQNHVRRVPRCPDCYRGNVAPHPVDVTTSLSDAGALTP
jgi:bacteriocin biosynthesis cyclodehydratase domain-containing protein